jgi:hypothetical protein
MGLAGASTMTGCKVVPVSGRFWASALNATNSAGDAMIAMCKFLDLTTTWPTRRMLTLWVDV